MKVKVNHKANTLIAALGITEGRNEQLQELFGKAEKKFTKNSHIFDFVMNLKASEAEKLFVMFNAGRIRERRNQQHEVLDCIGQVEALIKVAEKEAAKSKGKAKKGK